MRTPGNRWFLYDIGNKPESLIPFLRHVRADTLEAVFISHPDLDHFGAFPALFREIPIKKVYLPSAAGSNPAWLEVLASLDAYRAKTDTLFSGDTLIFESGRRSPYPMAFPPLRPGKQQSRRRSCAWNTAPGGFCSPATSRTKRNPESWPQVSDPSADLLKVPHHGSRTSSGLPFLAAVQPHWAVISCDSAVYGHPHAESLADLSLILGNDERILRTDREGTVAFEMDGNGIRRIDIEEGSVGIKGAVPTLRTNPYSKRTPAVMASIRDCQEARESGTTPMLTI